MPRLLALIVMLTGLTFVGSPAQAAVSVTITASPASLVVGSTTRIAGKAVNAKPGSIVKLQRRTGGVWRDITSVKVWSARTYSFRIAPPTGFHYYRVIKPRQFGQPYAASPAVKLTVKWRPVISAVAQGRVDSAADAWITDISGTASQLASEDLQVQRKVDGVWKPTGDLTTVGADDNFRHQIIGAPKGTAYRFVAPAAGLRAAAASNGIVVSGEVATPVITLSAEAEIIGAAPSVHQQVRISGRTSHPDATMTLWGYDATGTPWKPAGWWALSGLTAAADGSFSHVIATVPDGTRLKLTVSASDDGLRRAATSNEVAVRLRHLDLSPDDPTLTVEGIAEDEGAIIDLDVSAGELLSFDLDKTASSGDGTWFKLLDPTGVQVWDGSTAERSPWSIGSSYTPRSTGTYRLILSAVPSVWPSNEAVRVTVTTPTDVTGHLDSPMTVGSTRPEQVVDIHLAGTAGQGVHFVPDSATAGFELASCPRAMLLKDGQVVENGNPFIGAPVAMRNLIRFPVTGDYTLRLMPCSDDGFSSTVTLVSSVEAALALKGEAFLDLSRPKSWGVMRLAVSAGNPIDLERLEQSASSDLVGVVYPSGESFQLWPSGDRTIWTFEPTVDGVYEIWIGPATAPSAHERWTARVRRN